MTDTVIDDPMLDEEWLAAPAERSRLRFALVVTLAAAVCFLGGALVQKHLGADAAAGAAAGPAAFGGGQLPKGFPEGMVPGGGLPEGGAPGTSTDGELATDDTSESVIGKVVEVRGDVWIVEDLGGTRHEIKVGGDTDVVRETSIEAQQVEAGDSVDITGTGSDGQIEADEVVLR